MTSYTPTHPLRVFGAGYMPILKNGEVLRVHFEMVCYRHHTGTVQVVFLITPITRIHFGLLVGCRRQVYVKGHPCPYGLQYSEHEFSSSARNADRQEKYLPARKNKTHNLPVMVARLD